MKTQLAIDFQIQNRARITILIFKNIFMIKKLKNLTKLSFASVYQ